MPRKPIRTRDDAEKVAERIMHDAEALWRRVGGDDTPMREDEILPLKDFEVAARRIWQLLLRRP
jgi:hypothetical protein